MKNFKNSLIFILLLLIATGGSAWASWNLRLLRIPLYPQAIVQGEEDYLINGIKARVTIMEIRDKPSAILEFYRINLIEKGWRPIINNLPGLRDKMETAFFSKGRDSCYLQALWDESRNATLASLCSYEGSFPARSSGDLPGRDLDDVIRYPGSLRELYIERLKSPQSVIIIYKCKTPPLPLLNFYKYHLSRKGWRLISSSFPLYFIKKGAYCTVDAEEEEEEAITRLIIIRGEEP